MKLIEWDENLSVKIDSIDEQHKVLVDMINDFYEKIRTKAANELISELIKKMKNYTVVHFTTEERYFKQYNYPDIEAHKKEHQDFVDKVVDLEKRFNSGKVILSFEITNFLKEWLINHIQGTDMKYTNFLIQKGVK
ncbi:MAG: hemerythrin [Bacteroidetes bacterium]|nr:MAG: hemerythrin [Bacteroidota bacterium]